MARWAPRRARAPSPGRQAGRSARQWPTRSSNCPWTPDLQPVLTDKSFPEYAARHRIERVQVNLEPGDLYFFFSENIHEVPRIVGDTPRAVLAIFFAMSPDDDEIFVWS